MSSLKHKPNNKERSRRLKKTKEQKQWEKEHLFFGERHPYLPLVISIISLVVAIVKPMLT